MIRAKPLRPGRKTWVNDEELFKREYRKLPKDLRYRLDELGRQLHDWAMRYCYEKYMKVYFAQRNRKTSDETLEMWTAEAEAYWRKPRHKFSSVNEVAKHIKNKHGGGIRTISEHIKDKKPK